MNQTDKYGRKINYLRISVTDRCNLRCTYCMPPEGVPLMSHEDILRYEEITRVARLAHELGFTKFRITGGEPLARKGLPDLVRELTNLGEDVDLALTTNAVLLARYADELRAAGLSRINISLDTLKKEKFQQISRYDLFDEVMNGIQRAIDVGFDPVKVNVVVVRGVNDDEILDFVEMIKDQPLWVRFIELMPFNRNNWRDADFVSADETRKRIEKRHKLIGSTRQDTSAPAVDYQISGYKGRIGFIAPLSKKFCDLCNRLRLTADGYLVPCLHSAIEIDIRKPMRAGASDDELRLILQEAMIAKPEAHTLCDDNFDETRRIMSKVGG
ncbi:GTP 3',8-cyclase MoaA [Candidatus Poribacteria bacterium]